LNLLGSFKILLPPIRQQEKIASILSKVDELIQKTDHIIEQTQRLKKDLMQRLLTKGIGHTNFKKANFGFKFLEQEIPDSWRLLPLTEISLNGLRNGIFKRREEFGSGMPLVNVSDLFSEGEIDISKLERVRANNKEIKQFGIKEGDLFFCRSSQAIL
jgi:type I restriction enzyme, S subunit